MQLATTTVPRPRRIAAVAEGLAYVGGVLAVIGLVLYAVRSWNDFSIFTRLSLTGLTAALLAFGGLVLSDDRQRSSVRLRQVLWLGSTASVGVVGLVIADEYFDASQTASRVLAVAISMTIASGLFWWWRSGVVQHVTGLVAIAVAVGSAIERQWGNGAAGAAVWSVGALLIWIALSFEAPGNWLTGTLGAVASVVGALYAAQEWVGPALLATVVTSSTLLLASVMFVGRNESPLRVGFTVVGIVGLVQSVPPAIGHFAEEAGVNTGLVISIVGALLVLVGFSDLSLGGAVTTTIGAAAALIGAAVTGVESVDFAIVYGGILSILLVAAGTTPGHLTVSVVGLAGLVGFVPWGVWHFFPGEDQAPLIVLVIGALVAWSGAVLLWVARRGVRRIRIATHRASGM